MKLIRVGVDLAKSVFQDHGVDRREKVLWRRRLRRENWLQVLGQTVIRLVERYEHWRHKAALQ